MDVPKIAEPLHGPTWQYFSGLALKYSSHVVAGIPVRDNSGKGLNAAVVFSPSGEELCRYRKIHLFPLAGEGEHYLPGTEPVLFDWGPWKATPVICYDLRFPELFRIAARQGANLFVVIANWPASREEHWITLLRARAIENQAYVAGVNRCGTDPNLAYSGASLIVDPKGQIMARAGSDPECLSAHLDKEELDSWRQTFPALSDIRLPV